MPSLIPCGCAVDARDLEPATECTEHAALRAERDTLRTLLQDCVDSWPLGLAKTELKRRVTAALREKRADWEGFCQPNVSPPYP